MGCEGKGLALSPRFFRDMSMYRCLFVLAIFAAVGCGNGSGIQPAIIPDDVKAKSDQPLVAHPEYSQWSQVPEGSYSIRRKVVTGQNGNTIVTTKTSLKSKTEQKVSVPTGVST